MPSEVADCLVAFLYIYPTELMFTSSFRFMLYNVLFWPGTAFCQAEQSTSFGSQFLLIPVQLFFSACSAFEREIHQLLSTINFCLKGNYIASCRLQVNQL